MNVVPVLATPVRGHRSAATMKPPGAIAQLGERLDRTQEAAGSSPASSTARACKRASRRRVSYHRRLAWKATADHTLSLLAHCDRDDAARSAPASGAGPP